MRRIGAIALLPVVVVWGALAQDAPPLKAPQRWYYVMTAINDDEILAKQIDVLKRASKAGYTGVAFYDCKVDKYKIRPSNFDENMKKFRQACTDNKMDFIACVLPMGYCDMFLATDPNLAEGMPVRDAAFVVKDGKLVPVDDDLKLINGSLDEFKDNQPVGWEATDPGKISFMDDTEKTEGKACLRQQDAQQRGHVRFQQKIAVKPYHYYHVSVMVKTQDCESKDWRLQPYDGKYSLSWEMPPIKKTMGWIRIHMSFDSLDNTSILLELGAWNGKSGKVWWDDVQIEPGGFVNLIRRDSLPLKIASEDGKTVYEEGKDFSEVKDAKLINDPKPGYFTVWHDTPVVTIPAGSRLKEGQRVLASYHIAMTAGKPAQIMCCMCEPKVYAKIEDQMRWVKETLKPDAYFMMHDEIRHQGWDDTCIKSGKTCGQILADNVKRCTEIIENVDPGKSIVVWQDMFDPFNNAQKMNGNEPFISYLNRGEGPYQGSWEGLAKRVGLVNWNQGCEESYQRFSDNGHQQIISGAKPADITAYLKKSGRLPGVVGIMYTTWENDFGENFEKYVEAAKSWESESGGFGSSARK